MRKLVTAALGLGLVTIWMLGLAYDAPAWLIWPDAGAALVALAATGLVEGGDLAGLTTWPLLGVSLCALWLFGLGSDARWMAWLNLVLSLAFLALTGVTLLQAAGLPRLSHRRDLSHRRPLWHRRHQQAPA